MCESTIEFDAISAGNLSSVHVPLNGFPPFSHFGESGCSVTSSSRFSSTSGERRQGMQRACQLSLALGGWTGRRRAERAVNGTGGLQAARSLRYMAAVFERPPFRRCIKCSDRIGLGFLSAGGMTVHFRCRSRGFRHDEPLPDVDKKVIYLDQFAFSELFKLEAQSRARRAVSLSRLAAGKRRGGARLPDLLSALHQFPARCGGARCCGQTFSAAEIARWMAARLFRDQKRTSPYAKRTLRTDRPAPPTLLPFEQPRALPVSSRSDRSRTAAIEWLGDGSNFGSAPE